MGGDFSQGVEAKMGRKAVAVFGSTGSIGTQALEVIRQEKDRLKAEVLVAYSSVEALLAQAKEFRPRYVGVLNEEAAAKIAREVADYSELVVGGEVFSLVDAADIVLNAVVGFAGLEVTVRAIEADKPLALANKESLIAAGELVNEKLAESKSHILPVDSEHSAIFQCLEGRDWDRESTMLILTASGGPFFRSKKAELDVAGLKEALAHPTWSMGPKITVDSSTLVNKGLEVIEAHFLFAVPMDRIKVVIHPQSIVHSMVEFKDGSTIAQISRPDMRLAISRALLFPERASSPFGSMNWPTDQTLEFFQPDTENFPALDIAIEAGKAEGGAPCWFNAANEVAVAHFLQGEFQWRTIADILSLSMEHYGSSKPSSIEEIYDLDRESRRVTEWLIQKIQQR